MQFLLVKHYYSIVAGRGLLDQHPRMEQLGGS